MTNTINQLINRIEAARCGMQLSVAAFCRQADIDRSHYYEATSGRACPSVSWLARACQAAGLELTVRHADSEGT